MNIMAIYQDVYGKLERAYEKTERMNGFLQWLDERIDRADERVEFFWGRLNESNTPKKGTFYSRALDEWREHRAVLKEVEQELINRRLK